MVNENKHIINRKLIIFQHPIKNQRRLAKALNCTAQAINHAINGGTSYRINRAIADYLDVPMVEFWPELYGYTSHTSHDATVTDQQVGVN